MKIRLIVLGIINCCLISCSENVTKSKEKNSNNDNYVVMLSLDGYRHDYIEKYNSINIKEIATNGVHVKRMNPSNPTKTFPNHYSIATGLYPQNHGIIGNTFLDNDLGKYSISNRKAVQNPKFYGGEPIWNTAKKAGLKTASYFWIGSEAKINGMHPDIWKTYKHSTPFEVRVNTVITWLKLPLKDRPRLITLYFDEPDSSGHKYGPESNETKEQVTAVDKLVGILNKKLQELPIAKNINFIIVSDHGMRELDGSKKIVLEDYISKKDVFGIYGGNPAYTIKASAGKADKVYKQLSENENLHVYKKGEAPKELHMGNHPRTQDMIVIGKKGYAVYPWHRKSKGTKSKKFGVHGYLNTDEQMGSIFVASGNAFKKGYTQNSINNVDVYNLITEILKIKPAKNDGNFDNVKTLLK